jgi:hypothetical protein
VRRTCRGRRPSSSLRLPRLFLRRALSTRRCAACSARRERSAERVACRTAHFGRRGAPHAVRRGHGEPPQLAADRDRPMASVEERPSSLADLSGSMTTASWLSCGVSPTFNPVASRPAIDFGRSPGFPRARSSGDYRER